MSPRKPPAQTYHVRAVRWARGWELHITDASGAPVGVTQVRRLASAEAMVRDYLALDTGDEPESFIVQIASEVEGLSDEIAAVRTEQQAVAVRQAELAARARNVARRLKEAGLTGSEVGAVMGVSEQRASQLLKDVG
jgi:DNA-directed RNA polymerase specialized sigma subunit